MTSYNCKIIIIGMEETSDNIKIGNLLQEIQEVLKDIFVAKIRKRGAELEIEFLNGQSFTLTLFENAPKK